MPQTLTLTDLYVDHLKDMYSAESQITQAVSKIIPTAEPSEFKKILEHYLQQTEEHIARLEQIWQAVDASPHIKQWSDVE